NNIALPVARQTGSAEVVRRLGRTGLERLLRQAGLRSQAPTLEKILAWAEAAAPGQEPAALLLRILISLDDDRIMKAPAIVGIERELAALLVRTPYLLLLSMPGINVVSAAELAGEMGPIEHYAHSRAITGRAGLFPSRYQSDRVDHSDGPLVRGGNRALR